MWGFQADLTLVGDIESSLAVLLAPQRIRVNAIMPGTFRTDMVEKAYSEDQLTETASNTPLGRVADPTELVGPALFLASDMSSYVTGAVLTVDGGLELRGAPDLLGITERFQTVIEQRKHRGANLFAQPVAGTQILVNPDLTKVQREEFS
mgnify:CR=1 FL=1